MVLHNKQTLIEGLFFLLFGLVILLLIPSQIMVTPSIHTTTTPAFIPTVVAVALMIVGFLMVIKSFRAKHKTTKNIDFSLESFLRVGGSILLLVAYIELFRIIGSVVASAVFVAVFSYIFGLRSWVKMAVTVVVVPVVVWLVFEYVFKIPLPHGFLF